MLSLVAVAPRTSASNSRRNFTAKGGTSLGEPDIWDITQGTMYEVTTKSGATFRKGKLAP